MIIVMARYRAYFGKVNDIKEIVREFIERFRKIEGVLAYEVYQDQEDSHAFVHLIKFKDEKSETLHNNSEDVKEFADKLYPFCQTEPKFTRLKVVDII
jgi:quinol monooxygenase YgiN